MPSLEASENKGTELKKNFGNWAARQPVETELLYTKYRPVHIGALRLTGQDYFAG